MFQVNQRIIGSTEIVSLVIDVATTGNQQPNVLSACFQFLRAMTVKNEYIQARLFESVDRFLGIQSSQYGWQNDLGLMLAEVFDNNQNNCIGIKRSHVCICMFCDA